MGVILRLIYSLSKNRTYTGKLPHGIEEEFGHGVKSKLPNDR